jgi:hypothetical protein
MQRKRRAPDIQDCALQQPRTYFHPTGLSHTVQKMSATVCIPVIRDLCSRLPRVTFTLPARWQVAACICRKVVAPTHMRVSSASRTAEPQAQDSSRRGPTMSASAAISFKETPVCTRSKFPLSPPKPHFVRTERREAAARTHYETNMHARVGLGIAAASTEEPTARGRNAQI